MVRPSFVHLPIAIARRFSSTSAAVRRPDLDFDRILDRERHEHRLRDNIRQRKQVGDMDAIYRIWAELETAIGDPDIIRLWQRSKGDIYLRQLWDSLYEQAAMLPNDSHPSAPVGDATQARLVRTFGTSPTDVKDVRTVEDIVRHWKVLQFPRATCGARTYVFNGAFAELEDALLTYALAYAERAGFTPISVPDTVSASVTAACGVMQRSDHPIQYRHRQDHNMCLSGTAEMGICAFLRDTTFAVDELPSKWVALSRCYRPEVASGKIDSRLYRVREFYKVELYIVTGENDSESALQYLVDLQCNLFQSLNLHFRLMEMPTEELGASAYHKYDIEAWMPGRKIFGEISSASNCTDYQSRRLGIRYVDADGVTRFAHTCNATALASTRTIIALMENHYLGAGRLAEMPKPIRDLLPDNRSIPPTIVPAVCKSTDELFD